MTNLADFKKTLKSHRNELNRKYGVTSLGIFGSFVKNKQNVSSSLPTDSISLNLFE